MNKINCELMTHDDLNEILRKHRAWLDDEEGGERANLRRANLLGANLWDANLRGANLEDADLRGANLRGANLWDANLRGANLEDADLRGANLRGANLRRANLEDADLRGANGNLKNIKSVFLDTWPVTYTAGVMQIGCQRHPIKEWFEFDDDRISGMDRQALEWWQKHKEFIKQAIELSPAMPTKEDEK